jgi:uncharacterized protein (DUF58 family)
MTPLLAIENAAGYVGGAYLVFLLLLLIYVVIMAAKLQRIQRELPSLAELAEATVSAENTAARAGAEVGHVRDREHEIETVRQGDRG